MKKNLSLKKEILLSGIIFLLPFLVYLHVFFKSEELNHIFDDFEMVSFLGGLEYFMFFLFTNITHVTLLLLCFFTCLRPFRYFYLLPLFLFISFICASIGHRVYEMLEYCWVLALLIFFWAIFKTNFASFSKSRLRWYNKNMLCALILIFITGILLIGRELTVNSALFTILDDFGFKDASNGFYHLLKKVLIFTYLLIWFLTEPRWWKYSLLAPIILVANQLFNFLFNYDLPLDEMEVRQSGPFLIGLAIFLITLSRAVERQHEIKAFVEKTYSNLENKVRKRLETREKYIDEKRAKIDFSLNGLVELEKLKTELEQELQKP